MTERDEPQQPAVAPNPSRRDFINTAAMAGAGLVDRPASRARQRHAGAERHREHRDGRRQRHGREQHEHRAQPEHRRLLRRRLRAARRPHRTVEEAGGGGDVAGRAAGQPAQSERRAPRADLGAGGSERKAAAREPGGEPAALRRRAAAEDPEVPRLPRDAREAEGHRRGHRRDARSHARADRARRDGRSASTSTCRSRCAGRWRKRGTWRRRRRRIRRSSRRWATRATRGTKRARLRVHHVGRDRRRPRSARLDQPAARLLAAGRAAPGADARAAQASTCAGAAWNNRDVDAAPRGGDGSATVQAVRPAVVGSVPRRRAAGRLPPDLSPVQLARLGGLGPGRARRHGRAPRSIIRSGRSKLGYADVDRDDVDAVQRRLLSRTRRRPTTSSRRAAACRR